MEGGAYAGRSGQGHAPGIGGLGSGSGLGLNLTLVRPASTSAKMKAKGRETLKWNPTPDLNVVQSCPADKWGWGVTLTTEDIDNMIRGADRYCQLPHSGYDDELKTGKLGRKHSSIPGAADIEDPEDPNLIFEDLSGDIREIPDLKPDEYPLVFLFPPFDYAMSDSGSRPEGFMGTTSRADRKLRMLEEVDEPASPSSSYSGPTIPKKDPPHRPWLIPPTVGYVRPPSLVPRSDVKLHPTPPRDRTYVTSEIPGQCDIMDTSPGHFVNNPIFISDESLPAEDNMDELNYPAGAEEEVSDEENAVIPIGHLGMPRVELTYRSTCISDSEPGTVAGDIYDMELDQSPHMSEPRPRSDDDMYEADADQGPPLAIYIPDSDGPEIIHEVGGVEEGEVSMASDPDIELPMSVYVPGSDPEPEPEWLHSNTNQSDTAQQLYGRGSIGIRDPFTGRYTANSFGHFQDEWLE